MQQQTSSALFRFAAGFVAVYHLALGLAGTFASTPTVIAIVDRVYGVTLQADPQLAFLTRFAAAYMIVFGIAVGLLAWNPTRFRALVWVPITLFGIRIIERLALFGALSATFDVTAASNLRVVVPIAILAVTLFVFRPRTE